MAYLLETAEGVGKLKERVVLNWNDDVTERPLLLGVGVGMEGSVNPMVVDSVSKSVVVPPLRWYQNRCQSLRSLVCIRLQHQGIHGCTYFLGLSSYEMVSPATRKMWDAQQHTGAMEQGTSPSFAHSPAFPLQRRPMGQQPSRSLPVMAWHRVLLRIMSVGEA